MTKDEKFRKVLRVIQALKNSGLLQFDVYVKIRVNGIDSIKGNIGLLTFLQNEYNVIVCADRIRDMLKLDIESRIRPEYGRREQLMSYMMTLNLLAEYDYSFRYDPENFVHIVSELSYSDAVPEYYELEGAVYNMLSIMNDHCRILDAIAAGAPIPYERTEASEAFYKVMCDKDVVITPCLQRKPVTKAYSFLRDPNSSYMRITAADDGEPLP